MLERARDEGTDTAWKEVEEAIEDLKQKFGR